MNDPKGKVVAITGAAMGMGRLTADKFADAGAKLALLDVQQEKLDEVVQAMSAQGATVKGYLCDVSDRARVYEVFAQIERDLGPVDVLFNNAGIVAIGPFLEADDDKLEKVIQVNLIAHMWTMKAVLPGMIARGEGYIINFASMAGRIGVPNVVAYCGSKSGVIGLTEAMRQELFELKHKGIGFTIVEPSYVSTGMFAGAKAPWFTWTLKPEKMAHLIFKAYRKSKLYVRAPLMAKLVPLARGTMFAWEFDFIARLFGIRRALMNCQGREK